MLRLLNGCACAIQSPSLYLSGPWAAPEDPWTQTLCFVFLGELENAQSTLQRCLELDPTFVDAHLLMSQIHLAQGNFAMCSHCLELGVSHNFQVGAHHTVWPAQLWHPFLNSCLGEGEAT